MLLLVVSSLIPRKRVGDAVAAWTLLRSRGIECELVIAGDGALRAELESSVATSSWRSAVHFLGFTNQSELPGLYASADVFVFPSESDTWGLVVNEAMASGLPVVCADAVSASRDIVRSGVTGFTYTAGDVPALAGALSRVLEGRDSEAMREASAELISRWSLAETKAGYLQGIHRFGIDPERLNRD